MRGNKSKIFGVAIAACVCAQLMAFSNIAALALPVNSAEGGDETVATSASLSSTQPQVDEDGSNLPEEMNVLDSDDWEVTQDDAAASASSIDLGEMNGVVGQENSTSASGGHTSTLSARERLDVLAYQHVNDIADGYYEIASAGLNSLVLDAMNGGRSAGTRVQLYSKNGTDAQVWQISHDAQGYITIANALSGLVLDVRNGSTEPGSPIRLWTPNDTYAQKWIAVSREDGSYRLISALDEDNAIDVSGGSFYNGSTVQIYSENDTNAQRWILTQAQTVRERIEALAAEHVEDLPDGEYILHSNLNDWSVLEVAGGSQADYGNTSLYTYNGTAAQKWRVSHDDKGYITLTNVGSGKDLDVSGGSSNPGTNVQQYASNESLAQKWIAVLQDSGNYVIYSALDQNLVLDISNGSSSNGTNAQIWTCNNSLAQSWRLENLANTELELDRLAGENKSIIPDGVYIILAGVGSRKNLDVAAGSMANSANVQIYDSNMTNAQRWQVSHDENGYVTLTNVASGKVLDIASGQCAPGTNVAQYEANGSRAQKWIVTKNEGQNDYRISSALCPDLVLDVSGAGTANSTNVQVYSANGSDAQTFNFISTLVSVAPCKDVLPEGWYVISPRDAQDYGLDVASGQRSDGANVQLYERNGSLAQLFKFDYLNGYYRIISACSGKALDFDGGNLVPPTNALIWSASSDGSNYNQLFSVQINDDGSYTFVNRATGLALSIDGARYSNGANAQGEALMGSSAQRFVLSQQTDLLQEGVVEIAPAYNSKKAVDVASGSGADGANVQIYDKNGTLAQKWLINLIEGSDNMYTFENLGSGKVLTAASSGSVVQESYSESSNQQWVPDISEDGSYVFKNVASELVLSMSGSSGAGLITSSESGAESQRFFVSSSVPLSDGTYFIQSSLNSSMVLDVVNGSRANCANVQLFSNNDSGAQKWNISRNGDGTYSIQNAQSKKMLDVTNGWAASGANVQQYQGNNSAAQKWYIDYCGGGDFAISSALNRDLVLDVSGGGTWNGVNVQIYTANDSDSQRFSFRTAYYEDDRVLNVDRSDLLGWLESHEYDGYYIGTRYSSGFSIPTCMYPNGSPRSDGFTGMNCTGFVAHAYQSAGGDLYPISINNNHSPWPGGPGGGSYINAWRWYGYAVDSGAEIYYFNRVVDMLASGLAEKGDIIFFKTNGSIDCHIGFFWGNSSGENLMWHQILPGNLIGPCFNNANKAEYNQQTVLIKGAN